MDLAYELNSFYMQRSGKNLFFLEVANNIEIVIANSILCMKR